MPTYLYETIASADSGDTPEQFEMRQGFNDAPLATHPETGQPVRRVISGGLGAMLKGSERGSGSAPAAGPGCGPGSCGCGRF
ncbi:MAG: zinc ribbon domain-containing protein [Gemmatimonadaceae bacterium]